MHKLAEIHKFYKKIVIKIGTNLLADKHSGINISWVKAIANNVSFLKKKGKDIVIVTSGAIGAGVSILKLKERPKTVTGKQAVAAIGQPVLMDAYRDAFKKSGVIVGQVLLTKDDFVGRTRYVNAKNTFFELFRQGVVPVVNENDTVATEEIKLGDNDNLSALVANLIGADLLIVLTDKAGLYSDDPDLDEKAELIPVVKKITSDIEKLAKKSKSELSTGGMHTKIQAAKKCVSSGIAVIIADGKNPGIIKDIMEGHFKGTVFLPEESKLNLREKWIALISDSKGSIVVDDGAKEALLRKGRSLLPSGIVKVSGTFNATVTINVLDRNGKEIAKGISEYSSDDILKIMGKKSFEIENILHCKSCDEVIHRDNLVITK